MTKKNKWICLGGAKNPCAYCKYHKATLSTHQMEAKKCISKHCRHLQKYTEHGVWKAIEKKEKKKKANKLKIKNERRKERVKSINFTIKQIEQMISKLKASTPEEINFKNNLREGLGQIKSILAKEKPNKFTKDGRGNYICPKCGSKLKDLEGSYCFNCGQALEK